MTLAVKVTLNPIQLTNQLNFDNPLPHNANFTLGKKPFENIIGQRENGGN